MTLRQALHDAADQIADALEAELYGPRPKPRRKGSIASSLAAPPVGVDADDESRLLELIAASDGKQRLYFIACGTFSVKVGIAADPRRRRTELQIGNPTPLRLVYECPGSDEIEREAHHALRGFHQNGEWFMWCDSIERLIERIRARLGVTA